MVSKNTGIIYYSINMDDMWLLINLLHRCWLLATGCVYLYYTTTI